MSLIDEALKRAELEAARRDGLRTGASPWVLESRPRGRRAWWIAGAAVLLLAAAGGLWISKRPAPAENPRPSAPETAAQSRIPNLDSKTDMRTVEVPPPPTEVKPRDPGRGEPAKGASKSEKVPAPSASDSAEKRPAPAAEARPSAPAPAAETRNPRGLANGRTYVGEVAVPDGGKIALEGIVWSETNPVALINGKVLPPGAVVEEFTINAIQPDHVELKGRGITIFLALK